MANKIILKKSAVSGKTPQPSDLEFGEIAINYADGVIYYKDLNGTIQSLTNGANDPIVFPPNGGSDSVSVPYAKSRQYFFSSF